MEDRQTYEIKDICLGIYEGPHATPKVAKTGGIYLGIPALTSTGHINYDNIRYISDEDMPIWTKRVTPQEGDIVFTNEATLNLYAVIPPHFYCCLGRRLGLIRPNKDLVDVNYLFYYFFSPEWRETISKNKVSGATVERILMTKFPHFPISLPSLSTQHKISKILSTIDSKIENNRKINDNLEQQAEALYKSWFVDFEPFKDQEFVESEFGLIPEGWQCTTLSELLSIKYGKDHKKLAEGTIPVYGSGGLMRYVDTKLHEGEAVLIPRKGTLNNVMYVNEAFWTVDTMFYSIPKQENSCIYAYLFLANKDLASMNAGSAVPSMTTDILNNMLIIAPPAEVLRQFNNISNVYFSRINQNNIENANLSNQRDTLLPKLMSGELKVNEIDC